MACRAADGGWPRRVGDGGHRGAIRLANVLIDIKHAVRSLRRGAGPSVVSVLSLSLGIAATATMLSVVDAIDFRPLPFRDAGELVEIGVRIALGARPVQVLAFVLRQGAGLSVAGFAVGLAGSVATTRILQSLLVNAAGFDLRMSLGAGVMLECTVLLACYFPARRAARIDPAPLLHDA